MSNEPSDSKKREDYDFLTGISSEFGKFLAQFEPWVETRRVAQIEEGKFFDSCVKLEEGKFFDSYVKSSLAKVFDFGQGMISLESSRDLIPAYFMSGALRGICEDVIVLCYLLEKPSENRENLLKKWVEYDLYKNLLSQGKFFRKYRATQNVLTINDGEAELGKQAEGIRDEWVNLGWSRNMLRHTNPPTRAIAEEAGILYLYDFLYQFSCELVHFNPRVLLRSDIRDDPKKQMFSASNFNKYYLYAGLVYGAYLLCLNLQLLQESHRMPKKLRAVEEMMHDWVFRIYRWPEMVTASECKNPPSPYVSSLEEILLQMSELTKMPPELLTRKRKKQQL